MPSDTEPEKEGIGFGECTARSSIFREAPPSSPVGVDQQPWPWDLPHAHLFVTAGLWGVTSVFLQVGQGSFWPAVLLKPPARTLK